MVSFNASNIAVNGLNQGYERLAQNANSINQPLLNQNKLAPNQPANNTLNSPTPNNASLNASQPNALTEGLIGLVQNKTQMQSLLKVMSVEKQLFDNHLGKILDTKA